MIPDEREWQAQEKAMRCERAGLELSASDTLGAAYLPIARALRQPLEPVLPADFAVRVAALATAGRFSDDVESQLERWLLMGLAIVLGICALAAVVIYGKSWMGNSFSMLAQVGTPNLAWVLALVACLAVSWLSETVRKRGSDQQPMPT